MLAPPDDTTKLTDSSPPVGLSAACDLNAEVDALAALEVVLGSPRFWSPSTLSQASHEALDAYIDRVVGQSPEQRQRKQSERLAQARALRGQPAWDRIVTMAEVLKGSVKDSRRALAYAANLPSELPVMREGDCDSLDCRDEPLTWLPEGLQVRGSLFLDGTRVTHLPMRLKVGGHLDIRGTTINLLPTSLQVSGDLFLGNTPLAALTDAEILAMAPFVRGDIRR